MMESEILGMMGSIPVSYRESSKNILSDVRPRNGMYKLFLSRGMANTSL